ncbi:MAG: transposase [Actinomycetota bacterium]|nr:transposase [Actinomycetota bacterium]
MSDLEDLSREELVALVLAQVDRINELVDKVAKLEHLLSRNSGNSSMPPSSDEQPGKTPPKGRDRATSRRARGKQRGTPGANLPWSEAPEEERNRFPEGACECGADLAGAHDLGVVDAFQQIEIPQVRAKVTQYDQHAVRCRCGKVHTASRPEGAGTGKVAYGPVLQAWAVYLMVVHHIPTHRCRQLLEALTGAEPSIGFVHGLLTRASKVLGEADARIRTLITLATVLCMDETPLRVGPKTPRPGRKKADKYLLIACTRLYTHFLLGDRDLDTFKASVLAEVAAGTTVVHDRYTVYDHETFNEIVHQLCTAHLLRDLAAAGETYPEQVWPDQIADALRALIHATNLARENGHDAIDPDERAKQVHLLRQGVLVGLSLTTSHGNRPGEKKARALLEAFRDREGDILRFVDDLTVPPTSNDAERGLRPSKIQQKISGRLTSIARTEDRFRILGYLTTAAKHGLDRFTVLLDAFHGRIWIPGPATTVT